MAIADDTDRAIARWALGEASATVTIESLLAALERADALAAVVLREGDPVVAMRSRRARTSLLTIAAEAGGLRLFATDREETFAARLAPPTAGEGAAGGGDGDGKGSSGSLVPPGTATWFASEPFGDKPEASGALVVIGLTAKPDELLVALPRVAKAVAVVAARERADADAWKIVHGLNNLLAGAVANAEYAGSIIEGLGSGAALSDEDRDDIVHAIVNTRDGVKKMATSIKSLTAGTRKPGH